MTENEFRKRYGFCIDDRVEWGDMDSFQHVNNVMYFKYFERVRIAFFEEVGFNAWMKEHGVGPILHSTQCRFRAALSYPDDLLSGTYITNVQDDRLTMNYGVFSQRQQQLACTGDGLLVCFDYRANSKTPLPDELRVRIKAWEVAA